MGILNVTPDSFSDGGSYNNLSTTLKRAEEMIQEGAVIVDVGGESTRPKGNTYGEGADIITEDQEKARVLPIIEAVNKAFPDVLLSIDTYKPEVARMALEAGAHIVNDITGLRLYPETATIAQEMGAPLILMHSVGKPGEMPHHDAYTDVVSAVVDSLKSSIEIGKSKGLTQIVTDPGFGFGKTPQENLKLLNHTDTFVNLGYPVLVGVSRKSTIGVILGGNQSPIAIENRLFGTLGATAIAVLRGASIVRTHDVKQTAEMLHVLVETANA